MTAGRSENLICGRPPVFGDREQINFIRHAENVAAGRAPVFPDEEIEWAKTSKAGTVLPVSYWWDEFATDREWHEKIVRRADHLFIEIECEACGQTIELHYPERYGRKDKRFLGPLFVAAYGVFSCSYCDQQYRTELIQLKSKKPTMKVNIYLVPQAQEVSA